MCFIPRLANHSIRVLAFTQSIRIALVKNISTATIFQTLHCQPRCPGLGQIFRRILQGFGFPLQIGSYFGKEITDVKKPDGKVVEQALHLPILCKHLLGSEEPYLHSRTNAHRITLETREWPLLLRFWQWPHTDIHLLLSTCLGSQSCPNFHLQSNLLYVCRLAHLQDSSPLDAVILQQNTAGEEHSAGTEEAMLNTSHEQNSPQHSDACFPHALADKFSAAGACLCPPAPQWRCRVSQTARQKFIPWIQKWHYFTKREDKTGHAPSRALTWRFGQKPGCRKPTFQSVFHMDILGPIMASVLQRTILGRICLLISQEKRNHLPNIPSICIFFEGKEGRQHECIFHLGYDHLGCLSKEVS